VRRKSEAEENDLINKAIRRGLLEIKSDKITYNIQEKRSYRWNDPEEWVRAYSIASLVIEKGYPSSRIRTEVRVPRRVPNDFADIVVYKDDSCRIPFLVVECKSAGQSKKDKKQGIEQLFGNCNSLRVELGLYEEYEDSVFFDTSNNYPQDERIENIRGDRGSVPEQYGEVSTFRFIAGPENTDIQAVSSRSLETKIKRAHSLIWSGGKRDPLNAFDQWSKLLFAKVEDERSTPNGQPRKFQIGSNDTSAVVATRIHELFEQASRADRTIFPENGKIELPDNKIQEVVRTLQDVSITNTSADNIGAAFERFFGSVFRGELGQYFTMRQLARFTVSMLDISHDHYVIDPTSGSGGFLLEVLLQVWNRIDRDYAGRRELDRYKNDFALHKVFGIEIHEILARICKINLLLHHDGHTNIEGDRSCLDSVFHLPRLINYEGKFSRVVGNPPFGDEVSEGDTDLLGNNALENFEIANGRSGVDSEQIIIERCISFLEPGGKMGLILPDGIFNNQGEISNCPQLRRLLMKRGKIEAIVSLPDHAFRKSGAQNKTSILFFKKYTTQEAAKFSRFFETATRKGCGESEAIGQALSSMDYKIFLAEANNVGYSTTGSLIEQNDLYRESEAGKVSADQDGTILGEFRSFQLNPDRYSGKWEPDCMALSAKEMWSAHSSNRMDPKYHLFKREESEHTPSGWVKQTISSLMKRRENIVNPENDPETPVVVMTLSQTGEIRKRAAGKGRNPPEWLGMYFEESPSTWYEALAGDVVFSGIDLWKGCISVVPPEFDKALVTKEFPIYEVDTEQIDPQFLSCLLRSRYYQRAFRAITTGHSNRRRTQVSDFESLVVSFPESIDKQRELVQNILNSRERIKESAATLREAIRNFDHLVDGRTGDYDFLSDSEENEDE
jgi:type I restriction enzyme M protein